ncbi:MULTISPECIES: hypothetical protein [unclassified Streptomyces]|uniref:hypothetical protein n=1 Tax=unclassified Streptomyces TaxID=2593676 RepID=UPI001CC0D35D|nr:MULTISPECIES: hypothetical protein [unclassified Streptomyces]WPO70909.1 hypothetical protein R9806_09840 [Streptomyces sp. KN37]
MAVRLGRKSALELSTYRRIGVAPPQRGSFSGETCPDIFELDDGDFAVIGTDATDELTSSLPPGCVRGAHQRIVVITRQTFTMARRDIPDA